MSLALQSVKADPTVQQNFDKIARDWPPEPTYRGSGDPNGVVTAGPGAQYVNLADGKLWVHESASVSSAGWVVK